MILHKTSHSKKAAVKSTAAFNKFRTAAKKKKRGISGQSASFSQINSPYCYAYSYISFKANKKEHYP